MVRCLFDPLSPALPPEGEGETFAAEPLLRDSNLGRSAYGAMLI